MRKILIPTDFSDNAANALNYAIALFKYEKSEFFIMHAYQDEIYADPKLHNRDNLTEVTTQVCDKSTSQLEAILILIKKKSPNPRHKFTIISANSILIDEADRIVDKENIDLIVMGTRGFTNDRTLTFGSHTLQVLKYVQCPVLAIPENQLYSQPKHILFPTNYLIPYKRRELKLLCEMASPFRAVLEMLYITNSEALSLRQQDNKEFIKNELSKNKIYFNTANSKDIVSTITSYIKQKNIDMLVMVNNRHSFLENILVQSTIDKMSLSVDIPFLVLQNLNRDII